MAEANADIWPLSLNPGHFEITAVDVAAYGPGTPPNSPLHPLLLVVKYGFIFKLCNFWI
jgi:hypothetical protein